MSATALIRRQCLPYLRLLFGFYFNPNQVQIFFVELLVDFAVLALLPLAASAAVFDIFVVIVGDEATPFLLCG